MGCDIHLHTEVKIGGTWHHYSHPSVEKSRELFVKMAGGKDEHDDPDIVPISEPRGLPDDISVITRIDHAHCGEGYTQAESWLSSAEIVQLFEWIEGGMGIRDRWKWCQENFGLCFGGYWRYIHTDEEHSGIPPEVEDVRFVFWFDN
jgi:hypothetical protein